MRPIDGPAAHGQTAAAPAPTVAVAGKKQGQSGTRTGRRGRRNVLCVIFCVMFFFIVLIFSYVHLEKCKHTFFIVYCVLCTLNT